MTTEELKEKILLIHPTAAIEEGGEWLNINIAPVELPLFAEKIFHHGALLFNYLFCLTCIDYKTHLTMVYHFSSTHFRHNMVVKSKLDINKPEIETVSHIWKTAEFHEREVYEMFGVNFIHHPDLRLLILPDGWEGKNPLRKDFEDAVNMIRL